MEEVKSIQEEYKEKPYKRTFDGKDYGPTGSQLEWMRRNNRQYIDFGSTWTVGPRDFEY